MANSSFDSLTSSPDFRVDGGDFSSTSATVSAISEAGRNLLSEMFGNGAESVTMPKTKSSDFAVFAMRKGLRVA